MSVLRQPRFLIAVTIACAAAPALSRSAPDPYLPDGDPVSCISLSQIRSTQVRDDRTIDFHMTGRRIYRNQLPASCPQLGFEKRFSYSTSLSRLCSVDIITVLYNNGPGLQPGASCGLGQFQPMKKAPKK